MRSNLALGTEGKNRQRARIPLLLGPGQYMAPRQVMSLHIS